MYNSTQRPRNCNWLENWSTANLLKKREFYDQNLAFKLKRSRNHRMDLQSAENSAPQLRNPRGSKTRPSTQVSRSPQPLCSPIWPRRRRGKDHCSDREIISFSLSPSRRRWERMGFFNCDGLTREGANPLSVTVPECLIWTLVVDGITKLPLLIIRHYW